MKFVRYKFLKYRVLTVIMIWRKEMRIAFAGNPNSGKTTMYNAFTGKSERVGNWAGVTVNRKETSIKSDFTGIKEQVIAVDLPGAYSMSPFTPEESVTSGYVRNEKPDAIINIVDATNLSRSLFFTTQLLELGIPVVVALNKSDINSKQNTRIDEKVLADKLGCPVIKTIATTAGDSGLKEVVKKAIELNGTIQAPPFIAKDINLHDKEEVEKEDRRRYSFVNELVSQVEKRERKTSQRNYQDTIDSILTNKVIGVLVFAAVMYGVFWISQAWLGPLLADWLVGWIEAFQNFVAGQLEGSPLLSAILADGIIGGVGAVVGFLPLVMVMYFLIAILEDCGYMARATVVLDPIFKRVGLSGKSVIPMVIGTGCAIPGIMAARTIRDDRERRTTAMLTPFMPCGAKLPVIALFAGAFFPEASWVGPTMYFAGIVLILLWALVVKGITGYKYRKSFFIMEMPEYKVPSLKRATMSMLGRAKAYLIKAATIILVCNLVVQIMQKFNWSFELVSAGMEKTSILASIASPFAVVLIPLGFGAWQLAAASITGFIAKENVVGTLAVVYSVTKFINVDDFALTGGATQVATVFGLSSAAALAYLMFNLYTPPCFAAIGAMNSEMMNRKWLWGGICLQFGTGYSVAFIVYQVGTLITEGHLGTGFVPGLIAVIAMALTVVIIVRNSHAKFDKEYSLHDKKAVEV